MESTQTLAKEQTLNLHKLLVNKGNLLIRAIRNKVRQKILQSLHQNGPTTVTELYKKLHLEQSIASAHLAILRQARMVTAKREGKQIFYSVNYPQLEHVQAKLREMLNPNIAP